MKKPEVVVLGCGFTGRRVAARLNAQGFTVQCTGRSNLDLTALGWRTALRDLLSPGCLVLHSIPTLDNHADRDLCDGLSGTAARVVYLSSTSVYGATQAINEFTPAAPRRPQEQARVETEQTVLTGPWSSLVLRPAAIYGPGRGIHVSMLAGRFKLLGDGSNWISRIHVDDLASIAEVALLSDVRGTYPVGDEHPCPSREIAEYCARLLNVPMAPSATREEIPESRQNNRRVDGRAICRLLNVELRYPSYLTGIPASLES